MFIGMKTAVFRLLVLLGVLHFFCQMAVADDLPQQDETQNYSFLIDSLKTGVAWGLVPLGSEVVLNAAESVLKSNNYLFLLKLLTIHNSNIRRATSQHLTDNLSARLESVSYKVLSDDHVIKKTDDLQADLRYRSLFTFSILSLHAQKARKTYFRLLDITDTVASSARLALSKKDDDRATAMMALNAQLMVYIHPEYTVRDVFNSIDVNFSKHTNWQKHPYFRRRLIQHLNEMDPLMKRSAIMRLRYCDILNAWKIDYNDCSQLEAGAIKELDDVATMASSSEGQGIIKSLLADIPADQIRSTIFILGVSVPGAFMYFLGKRHPAIDVVAKHFAKIVGLATTKENMERFASQSRRSLENWGAINTGMPVNRTSGMADFTNHYFSSLQKKAGMILAEQPNFARSNTQRALESMAVHFSAFYRSLSESGDLPTASAILAGALVHSYREMVEVSTGDTLIRAILMAYKPFSNERVVVLVQKHLERLDPDYVNVSEVREGYNHLIVEWEQLSGESLGTTLINELPDESVDSSGSCPAEGCPQPSPPSIDSQSTSKSEDGSSEKESLEKESPEKESPEKESPEKVESWYDFLPGRESVATATIHGTALAYNMLVALIQPYTINKLKPTSQKHPLWQLSSYYFLTSMVEFGLRSIGEPAIVHLQTVVKNLIGTTTGILEPGDAQIQSELAAKVNELNRKLSIEAQTSRSYKMTLEALLAKCWSLVDALMDDDDKSYSASASVMAYSAYVFRHYHPEFETDDMVIGALAKARFASHRDELEQKGLMPVYARQVLVHIVQLDPDFADAAIKTSYLEILNAWGIECEPEDTQYAHDVLNSWVVYGDWFLGGAGFVMQAVTKAAVHGQGLILRSLFNFAANVVEFGTTDPLRKRIYAYSRQKMLNVVSFYDPAEKKAAEYANNQLTASFRRQKFYFGKPELDMRTQLVQIITSVTSSFSEAHFLIADNETDKATDLIALSVVRIILYAPDFPEDDNHLTKAFSVLVSPYSDVLSELNQDILDKVSEFLKKEESLNSDFYASGMKQAQTMLQIWANSISR